MQTAELENLVQPQVKTNKRLKVHWVMSDNLHPGNAFGYTTHNKMMKQYSSEFMDYDENSPIALHIISGDHFSPIPGKKNILFTMWEFLDTPSSYIKAMLLCDAVIVPCNFCKKVFSRYIDKPIYVCPEGADEKQLQYYDKRYPVRDKFRILWIGAPNPRKGYPLMLELIKVLGGNKWIEIYLKTTMPKNTMADFRKGLFKDWHSIMTDEKKKKAAIGMYRIYKDFKIENGIKVLGEHKNIIYDTRSISNDELVSLYNSAHCFVLPSLGEGWGLTLTEAMATGCPCIAPVNTGMADYFDNDVGYPLKYDIKPLDLMANYGLRARAYIPDTNDLIKQITNIISDYQYALRKGRRASERIRNLFTWKRSARKLFTIMKDIEENL